MKRVLRAATLLALAAASAAAAAPTTRASGAAGAGIVRPAPVLPREMPRLLGDSLARAVRPGLVTPGAAPAPGLALVAAYLDRARAAGLPAAELGAGLSVVPASAESGAAESPEKDPAVASRKLLSRAVDVLSRQAGTPAELSRMAPQDLERVNAALWRALLGERELKKAAELVLGRCGSGAADASRLEPAKPAAKAKKKTPPSPRRESPAEGAITTLLGAGIFGASLFMSLTGVQSAVEMSTAGLAASLALILSAVTVVLGSMRVWAVDKKLLPTLLFAAISVGALSHMITMKITDDYGAKTAAAGEYSPASRAFSFESFAEKYLADPKTEKSVAGMVAALPPEYRENYMLMFKSQSIQEASPTSPRIIAPGRNSKTLIGFNLTQPSIEAVANRTGGFDFYRVLFENGKGRLEKNPKICDSCHKGRPNWDSYDNWAFQLPFHRDRLYEGSEEERAYKRLYAALADHPVFRQLRPPKGVTVERGPGGKISVAISHTRTETEREVVRDGITIKQGGPLLLLGHPDKGGDEGQAVAMFDRLTPMNAERVATELAAHPNFARVKHAVAAILASEANAANIGSYLPPEITARNEAHFKMPLAKVLEDTTARRKSLPAKKIELQRKALRELIAANAEADGESISPDEMERRVTRELYRRGDAGSLDETGRLSDREVYAYDETIGLLRWVLEPESVPVWSWSMGPLGHMRTYTFADLFGSYTLRISEVVNDGSAKTPAERLQASLAAFAR